MKYFIFPIAFAMAFVVGGCDVGPADLVGELNSSTVNQQPVVVRPDPEFLVKITNALPPHESQLARHQLVWGRLLDKNSKQVEEFLLQPRETRSFPFAPAEGLTLELSSTLRLPIQIPLDGKVVEYVVNDDVLPQSESFEQSFVDGKLPFRCSRNSYNDANFNPLDFFSMNCTFELENPAARTFECTEFRYERPFLPTVISLAGDMDRIQTIKEDSKIFLPDVGKLQYQMAFVSPGGTTRCVGFHFHVVVPDGTYYDCEADVGYVD